MIDAQTVLADEDEVVAKVHALPYRVETPQGDVPGAEIDRDHILATIEKVRSEIVPRLVGLGAIKAA